MATRPTAQTNTVELSAHMRDNLPRLLGMELSAADAQNVANAIVQRVGQVRPGSPDVILSHGLYETFVSIPLEAGSKVSCAAYFEITPDGHRVVKRIRHDTP